MATFVSTPDAPTANLSSLGQQLDKIFTNSNPFNYDIKIKIDRETLETKTFKAMESEFKEIQALAKALNLEVKIETSMYNDVFIYIVTKRKPVAVDSEAKEKEKTLHSNIEQIKAMFKKAD